MDEETITAAKERQANKSEQGTLFNTEEWGPTRPASITLQQIVDAQVREQ